MTLSNQLSNPPAPSSGPPLIPEQVPEGDLEEGKKRKRVYHGVLLTAGLLIGLGGIGIFSIPIYRKYHTSITEIPVYAKKIEKFQIWQKFDKFGRVCGQIGQK